jgi:hypothetical protein
MNMNDPYADYILRAEFTVEDGKVVCRGEPGFVKTWKEDPEVYTKDDVDHENPITPEDAEDYLEALVWWWTGSHSTAEIVEDEDAEAKSG